MRDDEKRRSAEKPPHRVLHAPPGCDVIHHGLVVSGGARQRSVREGEMSACPSHATASVAWAAGGWGSEAGDGADSASSRAREGKPNQGAGLAVELLCAIGHRVADEAERSRFPPTASHGPARAGTRADPRAGFG